MALSPPVLALRLAGNFLSVKPAPDLHLWFGVGRPDASHDPAADIGRNNVSQQRAFVLTKTAAGPSPAYA